MSVFTVFLKNRKFNSKIRISKVTDYTALIYLFIDRFQLLQIPRKMWITGLLGLSCLWALFQPAIAGGGGVPAKLNTLDNRLSKLENKLDWLCNLLDGKVLHFFSLSSIVVLNAVKVKSCIAKQILVADPEGVQDVRLNPSPPPFVLNILYK